MGIIIIILCFVYIDSLPPSLSIFGLLSLLIAPIIILFGENFSLNNTGKLIAFSAFSIPFGLFMTEFSGMGLVDISVVYRQLFSLLTAATQIILFLRFKKYIRNIKLSSVFIFINFLNVISLMELPARIKGLSDEPSHFAQLLLFILVPILLTKRNNLIRNFLLINVLLLIFLTSSGMTIFALIVGILLSFLITKRFRPILIFLLIVTLITFVYVELFPGSYVVAIVKLVLGLTNTGDGLLSNTISDKLFSLIDPIIYIFKNFLIFGRGLGSESYLVEEIINPSYVDQLLLTKGVTFSFTSLIGKTFYSLGLISFYIFYLLRNNIFKNKLIYRFAYLKLDFCLLAYGIPFSLLICSLFQLGALAFPVIWFSIANYDEFLRNKLDFYKNLNYLE